MTAAFFEIITLSFDSIPTNDQLEFNNFSTFSELVTRWPQTFYLDEQSINVKSYSKKNTNAAMRDYAIAEKTVML